MLQQNIRELIIQVLSLLDNSDLLQAKMLNERAHLADKNDGRRKL